MNLTVLVAEVGMTEGVGAGTFVGWSVGCEVLGFSVGIAVGLVG